MDYTSLRKGRYHIDRGKFESSTEAENSQILRNPFQQDKLSFLNDVQLHSNHHFYIYIIYNHLMTLIFILFYLTFKHITGVLIVLSPTRKDTSSEACQGRARFQ